MPRMSSAQKELTRRSRRRTGYPIGTIAYYGPTDQLATKVAVGIVDKSDDPKLLQRWFSTTGDIRFDMDVIQEILNFLDSHNVSRVAMADRIIGCPHEEGIDYPDGQSCPECPFWHGRDRWTGELLH